MWAPGHQRPRAYSRITTMLICSNITLLLVIYTHTHTHIFIFCFIFIFCESNLSLLRIRWRHFSAFLESLGIAFLFSCARTHTLNMFFLIYPFDLFITPPHFSPLSPLSLLPYKCYFILISYAGATLHHDWMFHTLDNHIRYLWSSVCSFY